MITIIIVVYLALFFGLMTYLFTKAPVGYENKDGFHFGEEK